MLWEVVANALDEHLAGRASTLGVTLNEDGSVTVDDDGDGFPVHAVNGVPFAQLALTTHHATGTLDGHAPHAHVALHGVGIGVVNALSSRLVLDVFRDGRHLRQRYSEGVPETPLDDVEPTERRGTRLTFLPDPKIFRVTEMAFEVVDSRLRELSFLHPGMRIELRDDRRRRRSHQHAEGLRGLLDDPDDALVCRGVAGQVRVEAALRWAVACSRAFTFKSFANSERTSGDGSHLDGLMAGVADALLPDWPADRRGSSAVRAALAKDLQAAIHVNLANPKFAGPTRERLESVEAKDAVRSVVAVQLGAHLKERVALREMLRERVCTTAPARCDGT